MSILLPLAFQHYIPHGHCYLWQSNLIWLHLLSDSAIAIAYYSIPLTLVYLVNKREDLPFNWIFLLFGGFIVSCGTTHLLEVWTLWHPSYWIAGFLKALTAIISAITAVVLVSIVPKVLALPTTAQLESTNRRLILEVAQRKEAEDRYRQLNATLENRVRTRTIELERARQETERSEQQLRAILDNTTSVIYLKDLEGRLILVNHQFTTLFDQDQSQILGKTDFEYLPLEVAAKTRENDQFVLAQGTSVEFEEIVPDHGRLKTYISVKFPLYSEQGEPYAIGGISTDITDRKQNEQDLAEQTQELTNLNQALQDTTAKLEFQNRELDQFSYIVSHDLKAPLRAIANLSEWIEEDIQEVLTPSARKQMELLRDRVRRMDRMILGLLEYSRAGRLSHTVENVSVEHLIREAIDLLNPPESFCIEIRLPMPTLETERVPLFQIFLNLLSNAIKHHDRENGCIEISAHRQNQGYEFTVQDDGPGISPSNRDRIFNIFETLGDSNSTENTGIGLALVKKVLSKQGGSIKLISELGRGSSFIFFWPFTAPVQQEP